MLLSCYFVIQYSEKKLRGSYITYRHACKTVREIQSSILLPTSYTLSGKVIRLISDSDFHANKLFEVRNRKKQLSFSVSVCVGICWF